MPAFQCELCTFVEVLRVLEVLGYIKLLSEAKIASPVAPLVRGSLG